MARIDNLENFLTDVADAIREKRHLERTILAEDFDTEILQISGGGSIEGATATADDVLYPMTFGTARGLEEGHIYPTYKEDVDDNLSYIGNQVGNDTGYTILDYNHNMGLVLLRVGNRELALGQVVDKQIIIKFNITSSNMGVGNRNIQAACLSQYTNGSHAYIYSYVHQGDGANYLVCTPFDYETFAVMTSSNTSYNPGTGRDGGSQYVPAIAARPGYNQFAVAVIYHGTNDLEHRLYVAVCTDTSISKYDYQWQTYGGAENNNLLYQYNRLYYSYSGDTLTAQIFRRNTNGSYYGHGRIYNVNTNGSLTQLYSKGISTDVDSSVLNVNDDITIIGSNAYDRTGTTLRYSLPFSIQSKTNWSVCKEYVSILDNTTCSIYKIKPGYAVLLYSFSCTGLFPSNKQGIYFYIDDMIREYELSQEQIISELVRKGIHYTETSDSDGTASDVLTGKTLYGANGKVQGTMPNNGQIDIIPSTSSQNIPAGYTSGGTVSAVTSAIDDNIIGDNIKQGVEILGVTGTYAPTGGDATSDANIQAKYLLEGYSAVSDGQWIQGTMRNYGTTTIPYTSEVQSIPTGYYDTLTIPIAQAQNLDGYYECELALQKVNSDKVGYTELNYIQSVGNQFIVIDYIPKTLHTKYELGFMRDSVNGIWSPIINSENDVRFGIMCTKDDNSNRNDGQFHIGTPTDMQSITFPMSNNVKYDIIADKTGISLNGVKYSVTGNVPDAIGQWSTCINHRHTSATEFSSEYSLGKWYYLKIYEDDILVRDFIPVKRNIDDVICMYDKKTHTYFLNAGTGNFVSGGVKE